MLHTLHLASPNNAAAMRCIAACCMLHFARCTMYPACCMLSADGAQLFFPRNASAAQQARRDDGTTVPHHVSTLEYPVVGHVSILDYPAVGHVSTLEYPAVGHAMTTDSARAHRPLQSHNSAPSMWSGRLHWSGVPLTSVSARLSVLQHAPCVCSSLSGKY
jgi:hypothetical protein